MTLAALFVASCQAKTQHPSVLQFGGDGSVGDIDNAVLELLSADTLSKDPSSYSAAFAILIVLF